MNAIYILINALIEIRVIISGFAIGESREAFLGALNIRPASHSDAGVSSSMQIDPGQLRWSLIL